MAGIEFERVFKRFPGGVTAVEDLTLAIRDGEFMIFVGPSGCGKTTALRMVAGLEEISEGEIRIGGRRVNELDAQDRDIAMVFQNYALYPHKSVRDNIAFPLRMQRMGRTEISRRVDEVATLLGIEALLERRPGELSGGQRQRVAMGRAIVRHPRVFLMDEPLSNLDAKLRVQMRADIAALQARLGVTTVYVTHDQAEALTLGHRVAVLSEGRLQQCDAPRILYEQPANTFVAAFIGSPAMNLCTVDLGPNGSITLCRERIPMPHEVTEQAAKRGWKQLIVGLRPESLELAPDGVPARVRVVEDVGADSFVFCSADLECGEVDLVARVDTRSAPKREERVSLRLRAAEAHLFDPETGDRVMLTTPTG